MHSTRWQKFSDVFLPVVHIIYIHVCVVYYQASKSNLTDKDVQKCFFLVTPQHHHSQLSKGYLQVSKFVLQCSFHATETSVAI